MDLINISEFDSSHDLLLPPFMSHVDVDKSVHRHEERHREIREQLPRQPNYSMRSELKRLKTHWAQDPLSGCSPKELASAGFYKTGLENSCQCFCCGLVLCRLSISPTPLERHKKFNPSCAFIQGKDAGNIPIYDIRVQPKEIDPIDVKVSMENEQTRLQSFTCWPVYASIKPCELAETGFFFTGTRDNVQCFSCGGCLGNWEENDDPWKEHAKWFPECTFLQRNKTSDELQQYMRSYCGFMEMTGTSFTYTSENKVYPITEEEQDLILKMSSLECLDIGCNYAENYPEHLIRGIHNFSNLSEVTIYLLQNYEVLDHLPTEFEKLRQMKKLAFGCTSVSTGSIKFAATLKNFTSLKILNLDRLIIVGAETAEMFAVSLGSLIFLEKLWLPLGPGMAHAAKLIIEQFRALPNLQFLVMKEILDDASIALLGKVARDGFLKRLHNLELQSNYMISESGWTTFFETAADMPELTLLNLMRLEALPIKSQATTVTSFVRFVSRMPSLITIWMMGWQLDKDDFSLFNNMKEKHPQSTSLEIIWQIPFRFTPNIEN